jgi:UDP-N-acetylenolpyruvoylglucosamine reductase
MSPAPPPSLFGREVRSLHLAGAGGTSMAPLGLYLRELGFAVSAEDDQWNPTAQRWLERAGVRLLPPGMLPDGAELLVFSSAVPATHPVRRFAAERGVPAMRRGEMLAELMHGRRLIAVAGSHGKTTATALLVTALNRAGFPCGWVMGGQFNDDILPPARAGSSDWMVAEIDEDDGTIDGFAPDITLAVNLGWAQPDRNQRPADLEATFTALFARTRDAVFVADTCAACTRIIARGGLTTPVFSFGRTGDYAFFVQREDEAGLRLALSGRFVLREAAVRARGEFNALNAAGALAVAQHVGAALAPGVLGDFSGVARHQTRLFAGGGVTVFEDCASHPAEIRVLLGALRPGAVGRLVTVFQPHRYTRTASCKAELAAALAAADVVFLLDVFSAGEVPVPGGTTADLGAEIAPGAAACTVTHLPGNDAGTLAALTAALRAGDTVVFVGAGDIDRAAREFVNRLQMAEARAAAWGSLLRGVAERLSGQTRICEREPLAPRTTMRVGGPARVYAEPASEDDLRTLLREAAAGGLPVLLLGRGSNLIVPDEGVDALVLSLAHPHWQRCEVQADGRVWAGAGLRLKNLCGLAARAGRTGFEFLEGIPGSVGGALRMNAGAMGGWIFDMVDEVHLMTAEGERQVLSRAALTVDYRRCRDLETAIALGALFRPAPATAAADIRRQADVYQQKRQETQPREPSAGCVFKNPPGAFAGRLIDEAGLKGARVGDAEVSPVHANFIVNRGHATSADIIALMRQVRQRVREKSGVELEPEVLLFGRAWREVL